MEAIIRSGKNKGKKVTISQWCNDWFSIQEDTRIFRPTNLAFKPDDMLTILKHGNNGMLLLLFSPCAKIDINGEEYQGFVRRKQHMTF